MRYGSRFPEIEAAAFLVLGADSSNPVRGIRVDPAERGGVEANQS